jgi:hypothetical protein
MWTSLGMVDIDSLVHGTSITDAVIDAFIGRLHHNATISFHPTSTYERLVGCRRQAHYLDVDSINELMMDGWENRTHVMPIRQIGLGIDHFMLGVVNLVTGEVEIVDPQRKTTAFHRHAASKLREGFTGVFLLRGVPPPVWKEGTLAWEQAVQKDQTSCVLYTMAFMWRLHDTGQLPTEEHLPPSELPQLLRYFTWVLVGEHSLQRLQVDDTHADVEELETPWVLPNRCSLLAADRLLGLDMAPAADASNWKSNDTVSSMGMSSDQMLDPSAFSDGQEGPTSIGGSLVPHDMDTDMSGGTAVDGGPETGLDSASVCDASADDGGGEQGYDSESVRDAIMVNGARERGLDSESVRGETVVEGSTARRFDSESVRDATASCRIPQCA